MMAFCATMFTACSDDDDKDVDEGIADVEILPKKIKRVLCYEGDDDYWTDSYEYDYDADGRIISCKTDDGIEKYTYSGNKITIKNDSEEGNLILENGRIRSYSNVDHYDNESENGTLKYDGNYLNKVNATFKDEEEETFTETFSFSNGNMTKYKIEYSDGYYENTEFTYGNQLNNLNIDMFYFLECFDSYIGEVFKLGLIGKRSYYLPNSMMVSYPEWDDDDEKITRTETYTINMTYEMDGEYITKIIFKEDDGWTDTFVFEYE